MPRIHDQRKALLADAAPDKDIAAPGKKQALKGLSYEDALTALAPKAAKAYQGVAGLGAFARTTGLLESIRCEAVAVRSAGAGPSSAAGDFASLLNSLKMKIDEITGSAEYFQRDDLATRKKMDRAEKQRIADRAAKDVEELQKIIEALSSLGGYVAKVAPARDALINTLGHLAMR
ncbi:MAG: hypothetical protein QF464_12790, partial [Myxococcota bacterium]|nr:hypothetical protein [Myxococcota bacterium]